MRHPFYPVALLVFLAGCGPELSENDLGTVVSEMPKVADPEKPYPMPQLALPAERESDPGQPVLP